MNTKKRTTWERYQHVLYRAHRDGRLTFIRRRKDSGKDLRHKMRWNPNALDNVDKRELSIIPKWEMFLQIVRVLNEDQTSGPKDDIKGVARNSLYRLAKDFGMRPDTRHGLVYWYCKNPPYRKVFAWQIQVGSYSEKKSRDLRGNTAIYRNAIDLKESGRVEIIPLKRKSS
jgi:hypothetical protein